MVLGARVEQVADLEVDDRGRGERADVVEPAGERVTRVVALGVPQTFPPRPVNGEMVSCFLTPSTTQSQYTYPPELKAEVEAVVGGEYLTDVRDEALSVDEV